MIKYILAIFAVEAITNILTKSELFLPLRRFFFNKKSYKVFEFIHDLFDCGYCMSVWIGIMATLYLTYIDSNIVNIFISGLILHRFSNILHFIIDWLDEIRGQGKTK
jgi:hypothetical protein